MESSSGTIIVSKGIQNPFTLKVGQVFTGFGVGCGLGIGVGRPINLGAIPVLNQVMVAARGASDVFSGVGRHVNHSLKMVGAKNVEAGIGCGVGFGHGFGVGIAIKPGVVHQIQTSLVQTMTKLMMRFPALSNVVGGNVMNIGSKDEGEKLPPSRTEKVINNFLQTPLVEPKNQVGQLQSESEKDVIQLVLKQQLALEKLKEESEKLQQILVEDKFKFRSGGDWCSDCLECRRRQRRRR